MIKKSSLLFALSTFFTVQVFAQWSKVQRERIGRLSREGHQLMMKRLSITNLRPGLSGNQKAQNAASTGESKAAPFKSLPMNVSEYSLSKQISLVSASSYEFQGLLLGQTPSPLVFSNGTAVKTADKWDKRKLEIFENFDRKIYGRVPAKTSTVV